LGFVVLLLALGCTALVAVYLYREARGALPQLDGTIKVPGLSADVKVTRDAHGVATIDASDLDDLFFAQGYVTAQDRLWQIDVMRRYAAGELSEILGRGQLPLDREQRTLGLRAVAHQSLERAAPRDRSFFEAYARGVNAYMLNPKEKLPIEFRILQYQPRPWTAEDVVLMGTNLVKDLNHGYYRAALQKEMILAKLGPELTADLYVNSSWHDHPPAKKPASFGAPGSEDSAFAETSAVSVAGHGAFFESPTPILADDIYTPRPGSNNWVVSGAHTVSSKPLLSNDMHLGHQMPNLWYEVHLRSGSLDVAGVSLPGMPFVVVGHNQRIGWGFTNVGPTVEDLFVETFNDKGQYLTPKGWENVGHRREVIHVKGQPDEVMDIPLTRHGPIITQLIPGETRQMALSWTLYDGLQDPFFDINTAQNWDEFQHALSNWGAPSQNAVYADVDGHIGYHATGNIPIRRSGDGSLPANGSDDAHEWIGYVPFDKLPNAFDPPGGIVGTANGRITPDKYPYSLATEWDAPWRTERIYHVLQSGKKFGAADMLSLQTDIYSAFDRFCAERFVYALDHASNLSARARQARDLLRDWDGRLAKESAAATLETHARQELMRLLLEPKLGSSRNGANSSELSWKDYHWFMSSVWLEQVLLKQPKRWLPQNYSDYNALLTAAAQAAITAPDAPSHLTSWTWGKASPLYIQHPVLGQFPLLRRWSGPGTVEQAGGSYTVKQVGKGFGPSERMTVDFADLDHTTLNTVTGQGGNFLSPYYMDQWKAWYEGTTFLLPFSSAAVDRTASHRLVLKK
jgi:penicillin amidase